MQRSEEEKLGSVGAYVVVQTPEGPQAVPLSGERITVGKASSNDILVRSDARLSRIHAVLERFGDSWCVRDLGSRNGTFVNGRRVWDTQALRSGDEVRVGGTTLMFRIDEPGPEGGTTESAAGEPDLTRREREVLLALCRPLLAGDVFTEPASIRQIAKELVVTDAAVKQHIMRLYDKFGLVGPAERRRVRLANEALHRGAVTLGDIRQTQAPGP